LRAVSVARDAVSGRSTSPLWTPPGSPADWRCWRGTSPRPRARFAVGRTRSGASRRRISRETRAAESWNLTKRGGRSSSPVWATCRVPPSNPPPTPACSKRGDRFRVAASGCRSGAEHRPSPRALSTSRQLPGKRSRPRSWSPTLGTMRASSWPREYDPGPWRQRRSSVRCSWGLTAPDPVETLLSALPEPALPCPVTAPPS
jgi:hypothetical protein